MASENQLDQSRILSTIAVTECLNRYARAVDRCDWTAVRECYFEDAFDHHGAYQGGVSGLIEDMKVRHAQLDSSLHFISNVQVEWPTPDVALVESYCLCYLRRRVAEASGGQMLTTVRCRYLDKMAPDANGRWRIASRMVVFDEVRVGEIHDQRVSRAAWAQRDEKDPLWTFLSCGADWDSGDYTSQDAV